MSNTLVGALIGAILAVVALQFGFWGFVLVIVFGAIGALVAAISSGKIDRGRPDRRADRTPELPVNAGPEGVHTSAVPGRVEITARALTTLARAASAERLGVPAKRLRIDVGDHAGSLALDVTGPIREQPDIVSAASRAADAIKARVSELSGRAGGQCPHRTDRDRA